MLARVKGYSRARIIWRVALRNALIPAVTLTGVQFTFLVGGTVLIETIFSYPASAISRSCGGPARSPPDPGTGAYLRGAVHRHQPGGGCTYSMLNPRVRPGRQEQKGQSVEHEDSKEHEGRQGFASGLCS